MAKRKRQTVQAFTPAERIKARLAFCASDLWWAINEVKEQTPEGEFTTADYARLCEIREELESFANGKHLTQIHAIDCPARIGQGCECGAGFAGRQTWQKQLSNG